MQKRIAVVKALAKKRNTKLRIILFAGLLDVAFIWWALTQGDFLLVFVGLIVLPLLAWIFYRINKQPIRCPVGTPNPLPV